MNLDMLSQLITVASASAAPLISLFSLKRLRKVLLKEPERLRKSARACKKADPEQSIRFARRAIATDIWNCKDLNFWLLAYGASLAISIFAILSLLALSIGAIISFLSYGANGLDALSKMSATFNFSMTAIPVLVIQISLAFILPMFL